MKAWVLRFVTSLPRINENGLAMICDFVISDVKPGIFFLIGSRFRAFRLGPEGGWLDGAQIKNPFIKRAEFG